ncbi:DUF1819 family protein [Finegoldia magna]|uniref:DUF1819 family protein n=1 Tax=Finegoldia magna TaxID=1260 RepID=UPI000B916C5D|nr:DUF1819 family protein [Finegoldia magna]MDU2131359.1 DUF1819 family protein [Finegoldia magna]MDU2219421.1 DUF1819 family protein [Finegoldia magna]MDU2383705.1 DUF1819 family protein [Finegoldia magna]MDU4278379.1 DUF1819 family protein [Finegoldia magna]MDU5070900.1 DUF1819 family protein [Finegoldia magna]
MVSKNSKNLKSKSPYSGSLTREQFLFNEMRITAKLKLELNDDEEIINKIYSENLLQYKTEKSLKNIANVCLKRLNSLNNKKIVKIIAQAPSEASKQACLYAMMKQQRIVWDFFINIIGQKFSTHDYNFSNLDINVFILQLQEQDELVASWSDSTINKIKQVLKKVMLENKYIDDRNSTKLNKVLLDNSLKQEIVNNNDNIALKAFNNFE